MTVGVGLVKRLNTDTKGEHYVLHTDVTQSGVYTVGGLAYVGNRVVVDISKVYLPRVIAGFLINDRGELYAGFGMPVNHYNQGVAVSKDGRVIIPIPEKED